MLQINASQVEQLLDYPTLIQQLQATFVSDIEVPLRHHHDFDNPLAGKASTLLLMPAWQVGKYLGVKLVTVSPNNSAYDLPSIQGVYMLMDAHKGIPLALIDAPSLTSIRTAAASALAASYLARPDSDSLLMIGTGALAPRLIAAHASVRPIKRVYVWGRNKAKAIKIAAQFQKADFQIEVAETIEAGMSKAAIISCATLSETPLVLGKYLQKGQHLDLVGAYKPNMREADDEVMKRCSIYVDTMEGACKETGDIVIPFQTGILNKADIKADLFQLCKKAIFARKHKDEITLFKSVGHASEDLAAAILIYEKNRLLREKDELSA